MTAVPFRPWSPPDNEIVPRSRRHERLCVAAAILDGACVSTLLWLVILMILR